MTRLLACAAALAVVAAGCSAPAGPPPHVTVAGPTVPPAAVLPDITVPPSTTTTTRPPRKVSRGAGRPQGPAGQGPAAPTPAGEMPALMLRIRWCESRNDYTARNPRSSASGAWQFLDSTWANYGGYPRAYLAPPAVQDAKALLTYRSRGTTPWAASRACWA